MTGEEWALAVSIFFSGLASGLLGMLSTIMRLPPAARYLLAGLAYALSRFEARAEQAKERYVSTYMEDSDGRTSRVLPQSRGLRAGHVRSASNAVRPGCLPSSWVFSLTAATAFAILRVYASC